jgi:predicted phosphate transport protein (TIGR00153 family)
MGLQAVINWFLPKEDHFFTFLERQATLAKEGAQALARFRDPAVSAQEVREAVQVIEHTADGVLYEMEDALARTFVTPLDREDLHLLATELDDVVDMMNHAARVSVLYGVERPTEPMGKLMETLVKSTDALEKAMPALRKHDYAKLIEESRRLRALEKEGDAVFRAAVSALFHDANVEAKVLLREKEVLDALENAIDRCDRVAHTLRNLAVKHG